MLALAFLSQGITAPFEKDEESRPAGLTRDVVQHGDWLVPRDDYGEASRKPPLFYWLSAIGAEATGGVVDEARARAVSLIAAVAIAVEVAAFSAASMGESAGWLALMFLLGIYGFSSRAGHGRTDMLFTALLFSAWYLLYAQLENPPSGGRIGVRTLSIGLILGLAVLTKGPLALVLCGLAVAIYLALERRNPVRLLGAAWLWQVLGLALGIAALWYVPAFLRDHGLLSVQFGEENLGHLLPAKWGGTGEAARPAYYIVARMFGAALPLSLYVPALVFALPDAPIWGDARKPVIYQLSIVLAVTAMFSVASAKRDIYILPALPSIAILFSGLFTIAPRMGARTRAVWIAAGAIIAVAATVLIVAMLLVGHAGAIPERLTSGMQSSDAAYAALVADGIVNWRWRFVVFIAASVIAAIAIPLGLAARNAPRAALGVALMSLAGVSLWIGTLRPELVRGRTLKDFAAEVGGIVKQQPLCDIGGVDYELSFYLNRGVPACRPTGTQSSTDRPRYIVASSDDLDRMDRRERADLKTLVRSRCPLRRRQVLLLETGAARP